MYKQENSVKMYFFQYTYKLKFQFLINLHGLAQRLSKVIISALLENVHFALLCLVKSLHVDKAQSKGSTKNWQTVYVGLTLFVKIIFTETLGI